MRRLPFRRRGPARLGAVLLVLGGLAFVAGCDASEDADLDRGRALFLQNCGTCHTLAEAGSSAQVGPNLDSSFAQARADGMDNDTVEGVVQQQIANPRVTKEGASNYNNVFMPAELLTGQDAEDVATYVASVAGVPGAKPPELGEPVDVFTEKCGSCHTLEAAGTAGQVGPVLDQVLPGQAAAQIEESIRDPSAKISAGFQDQMPMFDEAQIPEKNLRELVDYLIKSVQSSGGN